MINSSLINGSLINGDSDELVAQTGSFSAVASGVAIEFEQSVEGQPASGIAIEFEQTVGIIGRGVAVEFEQSVSFGATASGIAVEFEQIVQAVADGVAVEFEQRVRDSNDNASHLARFGWDARVIIGGRPVPLCEIGGDIVITKNENAAALATLTLFNRSGEQDFYQWHGKSITIDIDTDEGTRRRFTGTVDYPNVDLVNKKIELKCTDRREERINSQLASAVKFIGYHSPAIYETPEDTAEELRQRLETTPKAVDFDSYGRYRVTDLLAKNTPDFTLGRCDITSVEPPVVKLATRARLVNKVSMQFEARWTRLRHRERGFRIEAPEFCDYMTVPGLDYLRVDTVYQTLNSFPWDVKPNSISFTYLPDAGNYDCGNGKFIWIPPRGLGSVKIVRDQNGDIVYDTNGNPVTEAAAGSSAAPVFCLSANWTAAKRWAQDISENVTISLAAPQSVNQYGAIEQTRRFGYQVEYDSRDYEDAEGYQSPSGFISAGNGDYYLDKSGEAKDYKAALQTGFAACETTIIKSHRQNTVSFLHRNVWTDVELYHTVEIDTTTVSCRGKVSQIVERYGAQSKRASTRVTLSMSRAQGSQEPESLSFPILDAPLVGDAGSDVEYHLYQGQSRLDFYTPPRKNETMKAPDIDDMSRQQQQTNDSYSYNLPIQNDPLTVNF